MKKKTIISGVLVIIILAVSAGFWKWKSVQKAQVLRDNQTQQAQTNQQNNNQTQINTSDWKTYKNERYGFELEYPQFLHINDQSDIFGGGVNFINENDSLTFSINITNEGILNSEEKIQMAKCSVINGRNILFKDISSTKSVSNPTPQSAGSDNFCFKKGNAYFSLNFWFGNLEEKNLITHYEKDMIESFRFIE